MHVPDPLSVHHRPVCVTFAYFEDGTTMVVDPGLKEEEISVGFVTLALNSHKEVCAVHKLGGVALSPDQLLECMRVAHVKAIELAAVLNTALKADEAARAGTDNGRGTTASTLLSAIILTHLSSPIPPPLTRARAM